MILVTKQLLLDLGIKSENVIVLPPVAIVNGMPLVAKIIKYPDIESMRKADWCVDAFGGGLVLLCEGSQKPDEDIGYLVRLHTIAVKT